MPSTQLTLKRPSFTMDSTLLAPASLPIEKPDAVEIASGPEPMIEGAEEPGIENVENVPSTTIPFSPTSAPSKLIAQTLHTASITMSAAGNILAAAGHNMSAAGTLIAHKSLPYVQRTSSTLSSALSVSGSTLSSALSVSGSAVMNGVASLRSRLSPSKKGTPGMALEADVESGVLPPAPEEGGEEGKGEEAAESIKPTTTAAAPTATATSSTLQRLRTVAGSVGASIASGSTSLKVGVVSVGGSLGASLATGSSNLSSSLKAGVAVTTQKTTAMWGSVMTGAKGLMKKKAAGGGESTPTEAAPVEVAVEEAPIAPIIAATATAIPIPAEASEVVFPSI